MSNDLRVLTFGHTSREWSKLQGAVERRLEARDVDPDIIPARDGTGGPATRVGVIKAAWLLGASGDTIDKLRKGKELPIGVQRLIRNPGKRNDEQKKRAERRLKQHKAARARARKRAEAAGGKRKDVVKFAKQAKAAYYRNPRAYHYLAGGIANTTFLKPTPSGWRSDCSQFVASVYKAAGLPSPAYPLDHQWASTSSIVRSPRARITTNPKPGDLGMYGSRSGPLKTRSTHHVELYIGEPDCEFIGHGSPPIDSLTPGRPDFYVTFDFLK